MSALYSFLSSALLPALTSESPADPAATDKGSRGAAPDPWRIGKTRLSLRALAAPLARRFSISLLPAALVSLTVAFSACTKAGVSRSTVTEPRPAPPPKLFAAELFYEVPAGKLAEVRLERAREIVQLRQVVRPDRRFLGAAAEIVAILRAKPPTSLTASWNQGRWALQVDGKAVGELSALPSFGEALTLLRREASELVKDAKLRPRSEAPGPDLTFTSFNLFSLEPVTALHEADRRWLTGDRDAVVLDVAGRALVALAVQSIDRVGVSDPLYARALAILAVRQAVSGQEHIEDAAMLAQLMGYESEAVDFAKKLPLGSPVASFVAGRLTLLREAAERKDGSPSTKFLFLLRFGDRASMAEWSEWVGQFCGPESAGLPLYRAAMNVRDFGPDRGNAEVLLYAVTAQVSGADAAGRVWRQFYADLLERPEMRSLAGLLSLLGVSGPKPSRAILERFEKALASGVPVKGVLAGGEPERCWYRSFFYSALYGIGTYELDRRRSAPDAVAFAELLDDAKSGAAPDFRRWFLDVARVRNDQRNLDDLIADVGALPWLGHPAIQRALDELLRILLVTDGRRQRVVRDYVARIDTRGGGRSGMTNVCWVEWLDLKCYESYRVGHGQLAIEKGMGGDPGYALYLDDRPALRRMVDDADLPVYTRQSALETLAGKEWLEEARVAEKYGELYRLDSSIFHSYVRYLEKHGRLKEAEAIVRARVVQERDKGALASAYAARMLAENLEKQGRLDEAWRTIEPWIDTWKGDVMDAAASVLESLGRHDEALDLARKSLGRYPDVILTRGDLVTILWRQGRYAEVPPLLSDPSHLPGPGDWGGEFARDFAEVFEKRPPEDAQKAFEPLLKASFNPWYLREFSRAMAKVDRYDTAFALLTDLTKKRPGIGNSVLDPDLDAYRYLRRSKGEEAALAWTKGVVTEDIQDRALEAAFNQGEFVLFWHLAPEPTRSSDRAWFLQAAAVALRPETAGDRRHSVIGHFRETVGTTADYGRYLLGLADEIPVFRAAAAPPRNRGEAAYVHGLRALVDGRYGDASDWFHVCREVDGPSTLARHGAEAVLNHWLANAHPMKMLSERKIF